MIESYIQELIRKQTTVKNPNYLIWLENFLASQEGNSFDDEHILYDSTIPEEDKENVKLLSYFFSYIQKTADEQSVFSVNEDPSEEEYYFTYNDNTYLIWTLVGQGAITGISLVDEIIKDPVILGRELTEEEKKEKELVEYIIINKDLEMTAGKIAAQVGHVCGMCAEKESNTHKYQVWKDYHDFKKITLSGHTKTLLDLEKQGFYAVRDKGYTEIPENSLTAVSLGIMTRKEAKLYVKRLQLFK